MKIEVGMKFGFLEIIALNNNHRKGKSWVCRCVCGKEFIQSTSHLYDKRTGKYKQSCGCKMHRWEGKTLKYPKIYFAWKDMQRRCYDQRTASYKYYASKNIKVCEGWRVDFDTFLKWSLENGYNEKLSLDRIDFNKDYEPSNCRWTNDLVQSQNRGMHRDNKSGVKGVFRMKSGRFSAFITRDLKRYNLGYYDTLNEAAGARKRAERYYLEHGTLEDYKPVWKRKRRAAVR